MVWIELVYGMVVIDVVKQVFDGFGDFVICIYEVEGVCSWVCLLLDWDGCVSEVDLFEDLIDELI